MASQRERIYYSHRGVRSKIFGSAPRPRVAGKGLRDWTRDLHSPPRKAALITWIGTRDLTSIRCTERGGRAHTNVARGLRRRLLARNTESSFSESITSWGYLYSRTEEAVQGSPNCPGPSRSAAAFAVQTAIVSQSIRKRSPPAFPGSAAETRRSGGFKPTRLSCPPRSISRNLGDGVSRFPPSPPRSRIQFHVSRHFPGLQRISLFDTGLLLA